MRTPLLVGSVLLLAVAVAATEPPVWQVFASSEGRFQILLPDAPTVTHKTRSTFMGPIRETRHASSTGPVAASIALHELPRVAVDFMPDRVILQRAGASLIDKVGGTRSLERRYEWKGHSAVEITYEVPGEIARIERARLILVETRLYIVTAGWPAPQDIPSQLAAFLESFDLSPAAVSAGAAAAPE